MISCSQGHAVPTDAAACGQCGEDLRPLCSQGHVSAPGDRFCEVCGSPVLVGASARTSATALVSSPDDVNEPPAAGHESSLGLASAVTPPPVVRQAAAAPRAPVTSASPVPDVMVPPGQQLASSPSPYLALPPFAFNMRRLTRVDQITGGATLLLMVSLFLPWFGVGNGQYHYTRGGINTHSYLAFVLVIAVALVVYLAARAGWDRLPVKLPVAHAPLLLLVGIVQLLLVFIAFISAPTGLSLSYGAWFGLIGALGAVLPVGIPAAQSWNGRR
jgi:hypothetical protein